MDTIKLRCIGTKSTTLLLSRKKPGEKSSLFFPRKMGRKGEGGLRKLSYFKFSYKQEGGKWYAFNYLDEKLYRVELPRNVESYVLSKKVKELPLITVITVSFNCKEEIKTTIKSVINQSYPNIEYIIVDGGSEDGTLDVIKKYTEYIDYWISEPDKGLYDAMNKGIQLSQGKWIIFLNAGDTFFTEKTVENVVLKTGGKNVDILYGDAIVSFKGMEKIFRAGPPEKLEKEMVLAHPSTFVKSKVLKENLFDTSYKVAADFELIRRLWKKGKKFMYVNEIISVVNTTEESISSKYYELSLDECRKITGRKSFLIKKATFKIKERIRKLLPQKVIELYLIYIIGFRKSK